MDRLRTNFEDNYSLIQDIGGALIPIYSDILKNKMFQPWDNSNREHQLYRRGRYVEFNMLYDVGIKFGLASNGNPDGMFMSLPPLVKWK